MNMVFFVTNLNSGGIENYLLRFLREKGRFLSRIFVWCKSGKIGHLEKDYLEIKNVEIIKSPLGYFDILSYHRMKQFLIDNKIGVVCDFTGDFGGRIVKTACKAGVSRRIVFYRNSSLRYKPDPLRKLYHRWIKNLTLKYSTHLLANSSAGFEFYHGNRWDRDHRFQVIYNGVDIKEFFKEQGDLREALDIPRNAFVIGNTGRYNPAKNHVTILRVAEELLQKYDDIYFMMCGSGVKENLLPVIQKKNLEKKIKVFENRDDIPRFLQTLDCYFFPSITEGQPNALIEAMIIGIPSIASNIPSIKETTPSEIHSYLKDPLDAEGFLQILEKIYHFPEYRKQFVFTEWAAEQFDSKKRFEEFYKVLAE